MGLEVEILDVYNLMLILDRPITLREGLILKYNVISVYRNILEHADLPYFFDQVNKKWWRYFCDIYGFYYSRVHRSYTIWLSSGLKKNIGLYMPFLMRMPVKRSKPTDTWKRRTDFYRNSMLNKDGIYWNNPRYFKKLNFSKFNINISTKSTIYSNFTGNTEHYAHGSYGSFGLDEESIFSGYNAKWHDIYRYWASFYRLSGSSPTSFLIGVNSFYMWSNFFLNLFDTTVTLYPENYLIYYNNIHINNMDNIFIPYMSRIISFWLLNYNSLYNNLLLLFFNIFMKFFYNKLNKLKNILLLYDSIGSYRINLFFILFNYYINKKYIFNIYNVGSFNPFIIYSIDKTKNFLDNIYFSPFNNNNNNNNNLNKIYNNIIGLSNVPTSKNYIYIKKVFLLNIISLNKLMSNQAFHYIKRKKQSNLFKNLFKYVWTSKVSSQIKNNNLLNYFNKNVSDFIVKGYSKFKSFSYINFSLLNIKKKFNIDIKRILTYGKLFLKIPSKILKHKFRLSKASSLIANKGLFRTFIFTYYKKNILNKIIKFNYNFFFILSSFIRFNFGFSFTLLKFDKSLNYYNNLDNSFFYNLQYFLFKYCKFIKIYLNKDIKGNSLFIKKKNLSYKILYIYLYNILSLKSTKKNHFLLFKKIRYFDYCYKGLNLLKVK